MLFHCLLLLSLSVHCSGLDMCSICNHFTRQPDQCSVRMCHFIRSLDHVKYKLQRDLRHVRNHIPAMSNGRDDASSIFSCTDSTMVFDMLKSFRALTELVTNLTLLNYLPTSDVYNYEHNFANKPLCQLNQVFIGMDYSVPESVCRIPPPGSMLILQSSTNLSERFLVSTLQRGIALMRDIKTHFQYGYELCL